MDCGWVCNSSMYGDLSNFFFSFYQSNKRYRALKSKDGLARIGSTAFQEIRNAVFANVAQKAIRKVACNVFNHLLHLDLNFHLTRQTGGLSRAIDRGTKGISFLLTSMVFHIFPIFLEISMVCGILVRALPVLLLKPHIS